MSVTFGEYNAGADELVTSLDTQLSFPLALNSTAPGATAICAGERCYLNVFESCECEEDSNAPMGALKQIAALNSAGCADLCACSPS